MAIQHAPLPIDGVIPDLLSALGNQPHALLIAPPGAGKTTRVAPVLLDEPWCNGQVLLLVPRRLAARAAAEFMASQLGEAPGATIGYATRLDTRLSKTTRVIAMTHGVFLARIQSDPELGGVSAVLFDEVHERSLDNDLALALTLDSAGVLRNDLRLVAMSATLDGERFGRLLGDPPKIVSEGRSYPLEIRHIGRDAGRRVEPQMASAIRSALADQEGSLLAFLPGVAEIERTAEALGELPGGCILHKLHGGVEPAAQRLALSSPQAGTRKLVLATSIAETSLTLEHVRIVIDSGLARRPRFDRGAGLTRLVTERASRASATQRAGRAARQGPGLVIRLWEEAATAGLPAHEPPEILEADLSSLVLTCMIWGENDPARLPFLDPPPGPSLDAARAHLLELGALNDEGRVTEHGKSLAKIPLEPRLAHMLVRAQELGVGSAGADVAALLTERGLGGNDVDLELRWRRWQSDRSPRAHAAKKMAGRLAPPPARERGPGGGHVILSGTKTPEGLALALALAFPNRVARRRDSSGESWQSIGGRGFRLDPASPLARAQWLAIGEVAGQASGARILSAAAIEEAEVLSLFADRIETRHDADFDPATGGVTPLRSRRLGAIRLSSGPDPKPDAKLLAATLAEGVRVHGLDLLPWPSSASQFRSRVAFVRPFNESVPSLDDASLIATIDEWLLPLLADKRRLGDIPGEQLLQAVHQLAGYEAKREIDRLAPAQFFSPAGSAHDIDYAAPGGPTVEVRAQALFGLARHPAVALGRVPLTLSITSPAGRPIQTTQDLPGFWSGSWRDVAREMRGRYPRHPWPDDPATAAATLRTKRSDPRNQ